jgi:glyoxylase I family protein
VRIHHVAFRTTDLARLERFYVEVLGFTVLRRQADRSTWLDAGGSIVMLELQDDGEPPIDAAAKELLCFAIEAREQARFVATLASAGVAIEARTSFTLYLRDPDGRRIGLSSYPEQPIA